MLKEKSVVQFPFSGWCPRHRLQENADISMARSASSWKLAPPAAGLKQSRTICSAAPRAVSNLLQCRWWEHHPEKGNWSILMTSRLSVSASRALSPWDFQDTCRKNLNRNRKKLRRGTSCCGSIGKTFVEIRYEHMRYLLQKHPFGGVGCDAFVEVTIRRFCKTVKIKARAIFEELIVLFVREILQKLLATQILTVLQNRQSLKWARILYTSVAGRLRMSMPPVFPDISARHSEMASREGAINVNQTL